MVQCANSAGLQTSLPAVEEVLDDHVAELGHDFIAYRLANRVLRQPRFLSYAAACRMGPSCATSAHAAAH
jgi:hypothetical protein